MKNLPNIWISITVAAVLVTALSFILPKNEEKYMADLFWSRKTFAPAKYDVVLMGDSRVYRGISPEIMASQLQDFRILNFAYSNGGLNPVMFEAAEKKLADNKKPKVIVMGISANTVNGFSVGNEQFQQELNRPREEILERLYLNPLLYWFSATSPEKIKNHIQPTENSTYYRNEYHLNGYVESEKFPADTMEAIPSYTDDFTHFKVSDKYLSELFKQVADWHKKGITIIGFYPPVSLPMKNLEESLGLFDAEKIKTGIKNAGGYWIELDPSNYKTYDGSHLNIESAEKLSRKIATSIEKVLN